MQRKRGELSPIGNALADLGGPALALRASPPPVQRYFTRFDQAARLVWASEADTAGVLLRQLAL